MRKQSQKSNGSRGTPDALDVSLRTAFCILNKQEMGRSTFLFTTAISKGRFGPQQPEPIGLNKPSEKGAYPKTNPTLVSVSPSTHVCPAFTPTRCPYFDRHPMFCLAFAFRPLLRFDRCPCPSGTHTHLASLIRQAPMLA